jgi:hypothetical protein
MSIDNASSFLIGAVLLTVALVILAAGAVAINNLLHKYWKPVTLFSADSWTLFGNSAVDDYVKNHPEYKAAEQAERVAPVLDIKEDKR